MTPKTTGLLFYTFGWIVLMTTAFAVRDTDPWVTWVMVGVLSLHLSNQFYADRHD